METPEARLKRMAMRSWRRGTKEMDLVLGPYADASLAGMGADKLDLYDSLLEENDQDLLPWVLGQVPAPPRFADLLAEIAAFARARLGRV
jgi:antitoxin CptB